MYDKLSSDLLDDEAGQDVHDEASQAGIHGQGLDDRPHEQHGEGTLLHQLLHHHCQNLRCVHVLLPKAQVGRCCADTEHFHCRLTCTCRRLINKPLITAEKGNLCVAKDHLFFILQTRPLERDFKQTIFTYEQVTGFGSKA